MNRLFISFVFVVLTLSICAQEKPLLKIGDLSFSVDEFNYIYTKNNALSQKPVTRDEYIDLFVNYKLKVVEAMAQGYDTLPDFKKELDYYRNELAKPYLNDQKAVDEVVKEAYEHMCYEVDASHILINLPKIPSPEDTLKAYKRITNVKKQLEEGADFMQMVLKYSEGPSAKQSNGRLGYFGAFMMVYPFEKAAFSTPVGQVSEITRTSFGYHLIKVHDKRKNKGEILVAHLMKAFPYKANEVIQNQAKIGIDSIYRKLQNGASFNEMVTQYSDDKQTVSNNGQLPWFGTGRMVPSFSEAAFSLSENGQISKPVKTQFGWHIIKRLDSRPIKPIEECKADILQKIKGDERAFAGKKATVERLKGEYNYTINQTEFQAMKKLVIQKSKEGNLVIATQLKEAQLKPAHFDGGVLNSEDFANQAFNFSMPTEGLNAFDFQFIWDNYVEMALLAHEKAHLEAKFPEFNYLMKEYHDGLLIFEISQKEIWNKASNDSLGLNSFYEQNKASYRIEEHFNGTLYFCKTKKVSKQLKKALRQDSALTKDSLQKVWGDQVLIKEGRFFQNDEPLLDQQLWPSKVNNAGNEYPYLFKVGKKVEEAVQPLEAIKGQVISDYQADIEIMWLKHLKEKYQPVLNTFAL